MECGIVLFWWYCADIGWGILIGTRGAKKLKENPIRNDGVEDRRG